MMKLLLVDDEQTTRNRIINSLPWTTLGIGSIEQADSAEEALAIAASFAPDILLTDVRMPVKDGIQLAVELVSMWPRVKIIFISGYCDKEYLKGAIRLGAVSYVEKPIDLHELSDIIHSTVRMISSEQSQQFKLQTYEIAEKTRKYEAAALAIMQSSQSYPQLLAELIPDVAAHSLFAALIVKNSAVGKFENWIEAYPKIVQCLYEKSNLADPTCFHLFCARKDDQIFVYLIEKSTGSAYQDYKAIENFSTQLCGKLTLLGLDVVMGIGEFGRTVAELPNTHETAVKAVQQTFYKETGFICYYKKSQAINNPLFSNEQIKGFIHTLKKGNRTDAVLFLQNMASEIKRYPNTPTLTVLNHYFALIRELLRLAQDDQITLLADTPEQNIWIHISSFAFLDQLNGYLIKAVNQYFDAVTDEKYDNLTVQRMIKYIRSNYSDPDLSITTISEHTNFSPTYICHLFKEVTGQTIVGYIFKIRMQKAQQFIRDTSYKVKDVAPLVGYTNGNYFSFQFKKFTGYSPVEYRENVQ